MKIHEPQDIFEFGKYKGEKLDFVFMFHPEYIEWFILNTDQFSINLEKFKTLHTFPFAQKYCIDSKYYNSIETFVNGEQKACSLREYLTNYMDLYEKHYLKTPENKNYFIFSEKVVRKNNEKSTGN
jgi:hypothetical protein